MRILKGLLLMCCLSSCYGLDPRPADRLAEPQMTADWPADPRLALISTDGQRLSPAGPAWQQAGLKRLAGLLSEQGLQVADLAPASGSTSLLVQGFPSLAPQNPLEQLKQTAREQSADLVLLVKQSPQPDLKVDFFQRQIRYRCEVALQAYSPQQARYLFQIKAQGENGYQSFSQTATLVAMLSGTVVAPALRLGFSGTPAQQQQGTQVISVVQIVAGLSIVGILAWDLIQAPVPPEERQQLACEQALQGAAKGLLAELKR